MKKAAVNNITMAVRDRPFERTLTLHKVFICAISMASPFLTNSLFLLRTRLGILAFSSRMAKSLPLR